MKLFILKLLSLLMICIGVVSLLVAMGLPEAKIYLDQVPVLLAEWQTKLPPQLAFAEGLLTVQGLWFTGSIIAIVFGCYGFMPRFPKKRKSKKISYEGPHGEVQIHLDTVENSLNHVLARMPEIKRINVKVEPRDNGRRAYIKADVVLNQQPGQNARAIASLVSDYIAESATKHLGLEELATIDLNVTGINVNSKKSSQAVRKESLSHSGNAPVELLEAAPAPLTLSGPREPLGSRHIEEELEDDTDSDPMEADAIDTRHEVSNQAAARSELLEPLNMSAPKRGEEAVDPTPGEPEAAPQKKAPENNAIDPLDMDVLHESLDETEDDTDFTPLEPDDAEDDEASVRSFQANGGGGHDAGDEALDDDPAYGGDTATPSAEDSTEASAPFLEATHYTHEVDGEDTLNSGFHPGGQVDDYPTDADESPADSDAHAHDQEAAGGVTIPEADEAPDADVVPEKKRWGWFN